MNCKRCDLLRYQMTVAVEALKAHGGEACRAFLEELLADGQHAPLQSVITWILVSERLPEDVEVGDRVFVQVDEYWPKGSPLVERIIVLEATEDGWRSSDPTYAGYTPEDGVYWVKEKDILPAPPAGEEVEG